MNSKEIRQIFCDFFASKEHVIVPSAPMINKNDPGLMFTNAGMNQFKDIFLGNKPIVYSRVADSQKCLRVSGKHNDLEEVGHDTYHHTMFEMLGNWSFGDYFKKEAIDFAWELLTEVYKIDKDRLYVTVFGGDKKDQLEIDEEAKQYWLNHVRSDRILLGNKKDNFWEMGEQGPCGPCSEIHIDLRDDKERAMISGAEFVNKDNPLVIEIWNLVFIQFNRKANGSLEPLAHKHIDTGMGLERLCMVLQNVKSNYDTDVFQPIIKKIANLANTTYGKDDKTDVALRVIADHIRAITFAIADGQLPSNTGAGYVIRRILRRAVRYGYTFLGFKQPFMFELVDVLVAQMGEQFTEITKQQQLCKRVIAEEEQSFLRTLDTGIQKFNAYVNNLKGKKIIDGDFAFELFDTFGFPIDLTSLMAKELDLDVDMEGFNANLQKQKERSRKAAEQSISDWVYIAEGNVEKIERNLRFCGYDETQKQITILKHRQVKSKDKLLYQLVFPETPFYAECGGQVGDTGTLSSDIETIKIINTIKENDLTIHITDTLPQYPNLIFNAVVDVDRRKAISANHSATHLLHYALRQILGTHVEQKGSYVCENYLRFDFSHYQKLSDEEISTAEDIVNKLIRENIAKTEYRDIPIEEAKKMGAMALFGEKYGNKVRMIAFEKSLELCGGTHVESTGDIGVFKIISESAVAAGIRRIEAYTAKGAFDFLREQVHIIQDIKNLLKAQDSIKGVSNLLEANSNLKKEIELLKKDKLAAIKDGLADKIKVINGKNVIAAVVDIETGSLKDLAFELKQGRDNTVIILGSKANGKAAICIVVTDDLVANGVHAGNIIREAVKEINGGGGGQAHFATAGGKTPDRIQFAVDKAVELL